VSDEDSGLKNSRVDARSSPVFCRSTMIDCAVHSLLSFESGKCSGSGVAVAEFLGDSAGFAATTGAGASE